MKDDEFRDKIKQYAEIEDYKVAQVNVRSKKQEEEFPPMFPPGENPTLGFRIKQLKPDVRPCSLGCGEQVSNQVVERKFYVFPENHWRTKCVNCGCTLSPDKTGFIEDSVHIQNAFIRHFKKK